MKIIDFLPSDVNMNGHVVNMKMDVETFAVFLPHHDAYSLHEVCILCGNWMYFVEQGDGYAVTTECDQEDEPYTVTVDFSSGKVLANDTLDDLFGVFSDNINLNLPNGRKEHALKCEDKNIAQGQVMNTNPFVYVVGGEIIIANPTFDAEADAWSHPEEWGAPVGMVFTDVWAYSFADATDLISRLTTDEQVAAFQKKKRAGDIFRFNVTPGKYQFTHYAHKVGFEYHDSENVTVYAKGVRVAQ